MNYSAEQVKLLVATGFCQPKFYKRSAWLKAKRLMDTIVCPNGLAHPFDFGRGKGKYTTDKDFEFIVKATIKILKKNKQLINC